MNPETFIIIFAGGTVTGSFIGLLIAGLFNAQKLRRHERETWKQARTYYRHAHGIEG